MKQLLIIISYFISMYVQAQKGFTFLRFSSEDNTGLSSNNIQSIYQDNKGFVWVGTANGLQRFDGTKFRQVKSRGTNASLAFTTVSQIIPYNDHQLVLNLPNLRRIGLFDINNFSYYELPLSSGHPLLTDVFLWKDHQGKVFMTIPGEGIFALDEKLRQFKPQPQFVFPNGYEPGADGVYDDAVQQRIWFATPKGLCVYDRKSNAMWWHDNNPQRIGILANKIIQQEPTGVFIDSKRRYWVFCEPRDAHAQVKYCLDSTGQFLKNDTMGLNIHLDAKARSTHFFESSKSGLWFYGPGNLFNWDKYTNTFLYNATTRLATVHSLEYEQVNEMIEDKDENLWLATDKGLYFASAVSGTFSIVNYLFDRYDGKAGITGILQVPNDDFWFSSWGYGVIAFDRHLADLDLPVYKTPPPNDWSAAAKRSIYFASTICRERRTGKIWLGCDNGVLVIYDPIRKQTFYLQPPELNQSSVKTISEDASGQLWLGTQSGHVVKWDGSMFMPQMHLGGAINKIFHDRRQVSWIATQGNGVYVVDFLKGITERHLISFNNKEGLSSNNGDDIEQLNDSTIVYAGGALNFINTRTGAVRQFGYEQGLPSNTVYRLRVDEDGFLWMITANGLSRYNPVKNEITSYGRKDGVTLAGKTISADNVSGNGLLIFAGQNAVLMFKPFLFTNKKAPQEVVITDFRLLNQDLPVDSLLQLKKISLKPGENSFSVYYSSMSFQQQNRLTYYYKMEGIDKDWAIAENGNYQNYSLLPPGNYVFKVFAENAEGLRSETTSLNIYIKTPFWRTPWFIGIIIGLIIGIVYFLHLQRVKRLLAVEKVRSRVARDLHDDMGSTLSTINILSSMAKSKMQDDAVKAAAYLGKISENSQQMMEAMDDIVWSIKPSNDSMQKVVARMREFSTDVLEANDILLHFTVADEVYNVKLDMEARRDWFLIFKEAVNNAAKYSKADNVWINLSVEKSDLLLSVKDNGIGFDVAKADNGNGLGNMQKRADNLQGKLAINSQQGGGTEIQLRMRF